MEFESEKVIYLSKKKIMEEFIEEHPGFKGEEENLTISIARNSYTIKKGKKLLQLIQVNPGYVFQESGRIYGYARISRPKQSIERQIRNIKTEYPDAIILQEAYTGRKINRPEWNRLYERAESGDTIVFDSVSRMSRNADEGVATYFELFEKGIHLVFLKEHYIDTDIYQENLKDKIELQGTDEDEIFKGLNNYFRKLAEKQIRIAFEQAEKEVEDLRQRTIEGIETARLKGKQIGQTKGKTLEIKKKEPAKEKILKYSKDFGGSLSDIECMKLIGLSRNTYYKYKKELTLG